VKEALYELDSETQWMDREEFIDEVELTFNMHGVDVRNSVYNAIERALGEQNDDAEICRDGNGNPEHDGDLRERERVPLGTDPRSTSKRRLRRIWRTRGSTRVRNITTTRMGSLGLWDTR